MAKDIYSAFQEKGYYIYNKPVVDPTRLREALSGVDMIRNGVYNTHCPPVDSPWKPGDDPLKLCKIEQPQLSNKAILELISSPEIGEAIALATGAKMVQVWWVQLLYKPSTKEMQAATNVGWHKDWTYWHPSWDEGSRLLTAWLALSNVTEESGPLTFIERSHTWQNAGGGDFFAQDIAPSTFYIPENEKWHEVMATMPAGAISLHDCNLIHGSKANHSGAPRISLALHVRTEKSRPKNGEREGLAYMIDDIKHCPIIFGQHHKDAF